MLTVIFAALMAAVLSNFWLLTNVSYAVPLSPTTQLPAVKITSPHKSQQIRVVAIFWFPEYPLHHQECHVQVVQFQFY
jgi:hypothetical protein